MLTTFGQTRRQQRRRALRSLVLSVLALAVIAAGALAVYRIGLAQGRTEAVRLAKDVQRLQAEVRSAAVRAAGAQLDAQGRVFDDAATLDTIARVYRDTGLLVEPHTAVGIAAAQRHAIPGIPTVALATAHPAKFPDAVERATGLRPPLPAHLADLLERPERTSVLPNDLVAVERFVESVARTV